MNRPVNNHFEPIDPKTSRSICDAVGERLRQNFNADAAAPSSHLQHLLEELRKRDETNGFSSSN